MLRIKILFLILFAFVSCAIYAQRQTANISNFKDSLTLFKKGIYFTIDDFLNNQPSVNYQFKLIGGKNTEYKRLTSEDKLYFIEYFDEIGASVSLPLYQIWGFCDGNAVFVSYEGKPYELMHLGAISILRYEHLFSKKQSTQMVEMNLMGVTAYAYHEIKDAYLDLIANKIYPRKEKYFEEIISNDSAFYKNYQKDKKVKKKYKPAKYFPQYNKKHTVKISNEGVIEIKKS